MIKLYNDDNLKILTDMQDNLVDCVITSPPYDDLRNYEKTLQWNFDIFQKLAQELYRVLKDGGIVVWVVADAVINGSETGTSFKQALYFKEIGFNLHDTMIYAKHNPTPNTGVGTRYQQSFEYMFVFSKGKPKTVNLLLEQRHNETNDKRTCRTQKKFSRDKDGNFGEGRHIMYIKEEVPRRNIWTYKVGLYNTTSDKIAFEHPAIFPEQLAKDHILSWTNKNDIVLDPFMGSGTVGKICKLLDRNFIGIEIVKKYFDIAKQRIENTKIQDELNLE